jgi:hypothetical protein
MAPCQVFFSSDTPEWHTSGACEGEDEKKDGKLLPLQTQKMGMPWCIFHNILLIINNLTC